MYQFICYPKCSTCQKALRWLEENAIPVSVRDIKTDRPSAEEITCWQKQGGIPLKKFFNTSGLVYKALGLKEKLPTMSDADQIALLASDGMLVRRPILVGDGAVLVGFREQEWMTALCEGKSK